MYAQNVSIPPDYFGDWRSTIPPQARNGHDLREEDNESCLKGEIGKDCSHVKRFFTCRYLLSLPLSGIRPKR